MTDVDDAAEGIVLSTQEFQQTIHFAHLTATFYKTLVEDGVGRLIARDLTRAWMEAEQSVEDGESA